MKKSKNNRKKKKQVNNTDISNNMPASAKKNYNPTISVCMIVKDEEQFLDNCLKSVKDIADEIIIIDTGSKDNTVDIAKRYSDKVFFHPWNDSFSEARNHYFDYAKGDWIFQIDADEELVKEDIPILLKAVRNHEIDAIMVQIVSHLKNAQSQSIHNVERIFRNNGKIYYEGRVHNRLTGYKNPKIYQVRLKHYGYDLDDPTRSELKHQRRITLLKKDIEDNPENPLPYHYLSCCYLPQGLFRETLEAAMKGIALSEQKNDRNPVFLWTRYNAAMAFYKLNDLKNAETMALSAVDLDNRHLDSYYILTLTAFDRSKWSNVIKYGSEYMRMCGLMKRKPEEFGTLVFNTVNEAWNILVLMGIACHEQGRAGDSLDMFKSAVKEAAKPFFASRAIGIYYYNKGMWSESREYLQMAFELNKDDPTVKDLLQKIGPAGKTNQTISCCMIVKNEEEFLEKCLTSVRDFVDELIIVDTGSTDSTVEIAKRFTDKIYFHPWENSFSKARNQALQYATGDWVFQIDGDEELMAGSGERVRKAVRDAKDADVIFVRIFCTYAKGAKKSLHNFERLFRNNGKIHYEGSVHNQVVGGTKSYFSSIDLWHYGYDVKEDKAREKFNRTTGLLKKEIEKDPDNPMYHHYLSVSYASRGMNEDALIEASRAVELSDSRQDTHDLYAWSHYTASMSCYRLGQIEKAKEYAAKSLNKYPMHLDSYYMLTIISADEGRWDDTMKYGQSFLKLLKNIHITHRDRIIIESTMNEGPAINILIGHAYYEKKSLLKMEEHYNKAYDMTDLKWEAWWNIGTYHLDKSGDLNLAGVFLERAVKEAPDEYNAWYMLAKLNKKRGLNRDEIACLENVVRIGTDDPFIFDRLLSLYMTEDMPEKAMDLIIKHGGKVRTTGPMLCKLAVMQLQKGSVEAAVKCYMTAVERDPGLFEAWASLGEITLNLKRLEEAEIFFNRALEIKQNDTGVMLGLCDIAATRGDMDSVVNYCDMLLKSLDLPRNRTISGFNELKSILLEIDASLKKTHLSVRINNIINKIS